MYDPEPKKVGIVLVVCILGVLTLGVLIYVGHELLTPSEELCNRARENADYVYNHPPYRDELTATPQELRARADRLREVAAEVRDACQ